MKILKYLLIISFISAVSSCKSEYKAMKERRNLMIPESSDLPRNKKYKPPKPKKTYSAHKKKKKK